MPKNVFWQEGKVRKEDREKLLKQRGVVIWLTGLPAAGKSTIARELEKRLFELGKLAYVLDGDNIRHGLNSDLGFSPEDRRENIRRIGEVAKLFADAGIITITAFISPYREDRARARSLLKPGEFIEVYVKAPLEVLIERDPKGLYKKALAGEIKDFTGISAPYEEPENPEIVLETDKMNVDECVEKILDYLRKSGIIPEGGIEMKEVKIPDDLYDKIKSKLDEYGFKTVDEYVEFVLKNVLEENQEERVFSEEEEEMIRKRLRDLGYLD